MEKVNFNDFDKQVSQKCEVYFGKTIENCSKTQLYRAICMTVRDYLTEKRLKFKQNRIKQETKQVYYMSMEFLLGRSLKNHLYNLGMTGVVEELCKKYGTTIDEIYAIEPDAGLGNGGLGRLAAAYMESLTNLNYVASGFSIRYDYGIFKQKIVDGLQMEMPDEWLTNGDVWLAPREEDTFEVKFGGSVEQRWEDGKLKIEYRDCYNILAVPYDMNISGYDVPAVNKLRLWTAKAPVDFDMQLFSQGEYVKSLEQKALAESICKVLYPADHHIEGKMLRLKQQYFFVSASIQSIIKKHIRDYKTLDNLGQKVAIHINDTHPTLCIPELMRILLDDYGYSWDDAWKIIKETISYTNHTVMAEALEKWPENIFKQLLPRIYQIVCEINHRYCQDLWSFYPNDFKKVAYNAVMADGQIKMANLCLAASHTVNGVSALHSEILKNDVFHDAYVMTPDKFTNVTNGITYRRWLCQANPLLSDFISSLIGDGFKKDANELKKLVAFKNDGDVLDKWMDIKRANKVALSNYIKEANGIDVDPDSIFDVQVKRLHEYKRQLLNALHILDLYYQIKQNPNIEMNPRTFIFGAKAAPSYYMAKQIIRLIHSLGKLINDDPDVKGRIKVVYIENYRVTLAEMIMPASDVSEQISIAGKEASGTGNMKFMINGAVTIGTMDGANIEIHENVGAENIFIFGLLAHEIDELNRNGYEPSRYYQSNARIRAVIDGLHRGIAGVNYSEIADSLMFGGDTYKVFADFDSYCDAHNRLDRAYSDKKRWAGMSLMNTAGAGFFSSDRSVQEYADRIWHLQPVKADSKATAKKTTKKSK
ncbi:MAG: glycogen/starch/alpha-glucan phosphorylase [Clostridia bacterium]|nr:glycogen/starch/alpha-glucan phosphorylase [Clostridia bacterium]MDY4083170.1 glycogen/starch/alpha-glucan phosphorylase [Eubacteriales bacterium]